MGKTIIEQAKEIGDEIVAEVIEEIKSQPRTVEQAVKIDIVVFDKYAARVSELKDQYGSIKINGVKDTEGYEAAKIAVRELRTTRTGTESDRKRAKEFYLNCGRAIDKKAAEIETFILELETPIKAQVKEIDDEKDRIRQERIQAEIERNKNRVAYLQDFGVQWDGANYSLDELSFSAEVIRECDDEYFEDKIIPQFKAIFDTKETIRIANEKALQDERDRQEQQKKDFEKQQQQLREQQAEIDRQNKELEKKRFAALEKRAKDRSGFLESLGMSYSLSMEAWSLRTVTTLQEKVRDFDEDEWSNYIKQLTPLIEEAKKLIQEENERAQKERDEQIRLKAIEDQKEKDRLEALKKQEEYERSTDKQKYLNFVQELNGVEFPILVSKHFKAKLSIIREKLEEINAL